MDIYDSKIKRRLAPKDGSLDVLADRIAELKELFRCEYEQNRELYDELDFQRFMDTEDDWHARRWIIYQREVPVAFDMLKDTMRWRKEMNLNGLTYEDFPREFYECGCTFEYGHDKKGRRVMYIRCRLFKPMSELNELYDKFFAFMIDQCDKRSKSAGFSMMYDVTDAGLSNVEMCLAVEHLFVFRCHISEQARGRALLQLAISSLANTDSHLTHSHSRMHTANLNLPMPVNTQSTLKFMTSLKDRFPLSSRQILIAGLPWVLTPVFKIVMSLIPASQAAAFKLINLDELNQYIDDNQIPTSMGGTSKTKFQVIPSKARSALEFQELSQSTAIKLKKHVEARTDPNDYETVSKLRVLK